MDPRPERVAGPSVIGLVVVVVLLVVWVLACWLDPMR